MPEITFEESLRQIRRFSERGEGAEEERRWDDAIGEWRALLAHPCAQHQVFAPEVLDQIHMVLRRAGRYDEAITAKREAIAAGYRSVPDPEADIAECLLEGGRRPEADVLFEQIRTRDPDDVWLYNSAAYSYARHDKRKSLRWSLDGIDVALTMGDPDQVVMQLLECAEASWKALGESPDEDLVARVEAFCEAWEPVRATPGWGDLKAVEPIEEHPCAHCGYQPGRSWAEVDERERRSRRRLLEIEEPEALERLDAVLGSEARSKLDRPVELSVAWFPSGEWPKAIERWPDLLDELPADHGEYSHAIEARIKAIARHIAGEPMHVSPLTVAGLEEYASSNGEEPGSAEARSMYAAEVLRQGAATRWPPGRNDRCWCGSGQKYKHCCGPVPADQD